MGRPPPGNVEGGLGFVCVEAAVVTIGTMYPTSAEPDPDGRVIFHADHPFLYVISETSTGAILFTGRYGA